MPWIPRGLREGIVTTTYPRRPDGYDGGFRGAVDVRGKFPFDEGLTAAVEACPTNAISLERDRVHLDRGRCVLCGVCTALSPQTFGFVPTLETSVARREHLIVPRLEEDEAAIGRARTDLARRVKALRRSVHIRHVDAGSDGAEEWEIAALTNPVYDVQRLGIFFTASPRHADLLLATGVGAAGMREPLRETFEVMPEPKIVIAAGVDAISGGLFGHGYVARGGVSDDVPVDVFVPGSPPSPFGLLHGILLAVGLLPAVSARAFPNVARRPRKQPEGGSHGPASAEDPPQEAGP
jgi:Ni,Fe-hydrogenase III small subunit/ferredoxin